MHRNDFITFEQLGRDLAKVPGMSKIIEEERATLRAAEFVKQARKSAHLSQAGLAKKLDVTQVRISQLEHGEGKNGPTLALLQRVARACGGSLQLTFEKSV
jgi:DNA-binding XRE family transcriptional regulator